MYLSTLALAAARDAFVPLRGNSPRERSLAEELRGVSQLEAHRVVAAMTTTPVRIGHIEKAIDSLLNQTRRGRPHWAFGRLRSPILMLL